MLEIQHNENLNFYVKNRLIKVKGAVIFLGTRLNLEKKYLLKRCGRIYEALNLPCVPVALNTGKLWPKNSFLKYRSDVHISFLEPIGPGKDKNIFLKDLETKIYSAIEKLN